MSDQRHRQLNEQLRDALLAFYLTYVLPEDTTLQTPARKHTINNANDLYTYWLLDVQVSQAVPTSRVASAIASLQQYINAESCLPFRYLKHTSKLTRKLGNSDILRCNTTKSSTSNRPCHQLRHSHRVG